MKDELLKLIQSKEARKAELLGNVRSSQNIEEIKGMNTEIAALNSDLSQLNAMLESEEKRNGIDPYDPNIAAMPPRTEEEKRSLIENMKNKRSQDHQLKVLATYGIGNGVNSNNTEQRGAGMISEELKSKYEQRGQALKDRKSVDFDIAELRSLTVASSDLIVPTQYSNTLNPAFNQVSNIVDLVNSVPLMGGNAYTKGFVKSYGEGDYTTETGDYVDADPVMDYVTIGKAKITAYTEMSDEAAKLPNVDYQSEVAKNINIAIRSKIGKQLMAGLGGTNQIVGIFKAPENVIPAASDMEISAIGADTLDQIVYGYGGDENVEGAAYLILSKKDLSAFAAVRTANGEKLYKIQSNGNVGTISSDGSYSVNFVLNSICPSLSDSSTAAATYCMAYGVLKAYEMPVFSPVTVEESRDFKFKSGQVCYRGSVWIGGNVASYKGFTRIKKA